MSFFLPASPSEHSSSDFTNFPISIFCFHFPHWFHSFIYLFIYLSITKIREAVCALILAISSITTERMEEVNVSVHPYFVIIAILYECISSRLMQHFSFTFDFATSLMGTARATGHKRSTSNLALPNPKREGGRGRGSQMGSQIPRWGDPRLLRRVMQPKEGSFSQCKNWSA